MLYTSFFLSPRWGKEAGMSTLAWDVSGYYWYLPSIFIYKDLKQQKFGDSILSKYAITPSFEQSLPNESGNRVMVYSSGMAIMYLPFFAIAHTAAYISGYPPDGFSLPYQLLIPIGSLLIAFIGIWFFRKLLLIYYSDKVAAIMLVLLVFGTNYLNYTTFDAALTHNWLFTLYIFLILNTINFYRTFHYKYAVRIGLLCGLLVLIRPSEIISVMIPLLWGIDRISWREISKRLLLFITNWQKIFTAIACSIAVGLIQVGYWLYVTGKPFVYSYGSHGFTWKHPHTWDYIFSYRSGWAVYTPMVFLMLLAFIPFLFKGRNRIAVICFFVINLYIVSAWDVWWYGGTGGRAMIQSYPVLLFPLAALIDLMLSVRILKWVLSPLLIVCIYFNLWFTYQAHAISGLYDPEGMTKAYFWAVAGRWSASDQVRKLKTTDELYTGIPKNKELIYYNDFELETNIKDIPMPPIKGKISAYTDGSHEYSIMSSFAFKKTKNRWLRAQATFANTEKEWTGWKMPQLTVRFTNKGEIVKANGIRIPYFMTDGQTEDVFIDTKIPTTDFDSVTIFVWNPGSAHPLIFDNLTVWSFN